MMDKNYNDKDLENAINKASEIQNSYNQSKTNLNQSELEEILSDLGFEPKIANSAISDINFDKQSKFFDNPVIVLFFIIFGFGTWMGLSMLGTSMIAENYTPAQLAQLSEGEKIKKGTKEIGIFLALAVLLSSPFGAWIICENEKIDS